MFSYTILVPYVQIVVHTYYHVCAGSACLPRATLRSTHAISWKRARSTSGMPQITPNPWPVVFVSVNVKICDVRSSCLRRLCLQCFWLCNFLPVRWHNIHNYFFHCTQTVLDKFFMYCLRHCFICRPFEVAGSDGLLKRLHRQSDSIQHNQ